MTRSEEFRAGLSDNFDNPDPGDVVLISEVCSTLDLIDALEDAAKSGGYIVTGSRGQPTAHPALSEVRQQRLALARLLLQLGIEDESPTTKRARAAADARWKKGAP